MMGRFKKLWERDEAPTCKLCGARLEQEEQPCPDCGYLAGTESNVFYISEREADARSAPTPALAQKALDPDGDDVGGPDVGVAPEGEGEGGRPVQKVPEASGPVLALDPAGLRKLLTQQPEILEPGLSIFTEKGKPVGEGYSSGVGVIDLLARDASGAIVVVKVAERGQEEDLVPATLQRIGWVRKHLGRSKENVRGIIVVEHLPESLSYTASATAGTIAFKTYRVAVTFEDVEM